MAEFWNPTGLITRICPDPEAVEQVLRDIIAKAQELATASPYLRPAEKGIQAGAGTQHRGGTVNGAAKLLGPRVITATSPKPKAPPWA